MFQGLAGVRLEARIQLVTLTDPIEIGNYCKGPKTLHTHYNTLGN